MEVDESTTRHKRYPNVWSAGDASSLPTSKTAATVTSQTPVLVRNLLLAMEGKSNQGDNDGYISCPMPTEIGKVLLAELKFGGVPKENFGKLVNRATPRSRPTTCILSFGEKLSFPLELLKSYSKGHLGRV